MGLLKLGDFVSFMFLGIIIYFFVVEFLKNFELKYLNNFVKIFFVKLS